MTGLHGGGAGPAHGSHDLVDGQDEALMPARNLLVPDGAELISAATLRAAMPRLVHDLERLAFAALVARGAAP
jgi:hypothetical protein